MDAGGSHTGMPQHPGNGVQHTVESTAMGVASVSLVNSQEGWTSAYRRPADYPVFTGYRSVNGGLDWTQQYEYPESLPEGPSTIILFVDPNTGWNTTSACNEAIPLPLCSSSLDGTSDGGQSWSSLLHIQNG